MKITKEMYQKVQQYFAAIDPDQLYRDLVNNYGLEAGEFMCSVEVKTVNITEGVNILSEDIEYSHPVSVKNENPSGNDYALAA